MTRPTVENWCTENLPLRPTTNAKMDVIQRAICDCGDTGKVTEVRFIVPNRIGFTAALCDPDFASLVLGVDIYGPKASKT